MSKISLIAKLSAAEGKETELEARLGDLVAAADEEDGLEVYTSFRATDQPGTYYFVEVYRDEEAWGVHGKGDGMRAAMGALGGLLGGRPEIIMLEPVASKGLDV